MISHELWSSPEEPMQTGPNPNASLIPSAQYRYRQQMAQEQLTITGSTEKYLDKDKEWELGHVIQAARHTKDEITLLEEKNPKLAEQTSSKYAHLLKAGEEAQDILVRANLRFAAYYARASMNITAPPKQSRSQPQAEEFDNGPLLDQAFERKRFIGAYGDIRRLRSAYANLDDRTQVANMALVQAAAAFSPTIRNGKRVGFTTFAAWKIHAALSRYVGTSEKPGWYVPAEIANDITTAYTKPEKFTDERRGKLAQFHAGRFTIALDDVELNIEAPEEDDPWRPAPHLTLAEVLPDHCLDPATQYAIDGILEDEISQALMTLSEREAGVLRLRYGFRGESRTLDEVGIVYGVTRERVRQIEKKALEKMAKYVSGVHGMAEYLTEESEPPFLDRSITTGSDYCIGIKNERIAVGYNDGGSYQQIVPEKEVPLLTASHTSSHARWQAYEGEEWDDPVRISPDEQLRSYEQTAALFASLLRTMPTYVFQHSFAKGIDTIYPVEAIHHIRNTLGKSLTASHIEDYWNRSAEPFIDLLSKTCGSDFDLTRVSTFFSRLLAEYMTDDDRIELTIPASLDKKLHYFGSRLTNGQLVIKGNLGDFAGYQAKGLACIEVHGSVADHAAYGLRDYARVDVIGTAGKHFGEACDEDTTAAVYPAP